MIKHLTVHGNELALVLEKEIWQLLGMTRSTPLKISTDGSRIIITPEACGIIMRSKFDKKIGGKALKAMRRKRSLPKLIAQMPKDYRAIEEEWGKPLGREVW